MGAVSAMRIAILGSNGHVGRNLASRWLAAGSNSMHLYSRDLIATSKLFGRSATSVGVCFPAYSEFYQHEYDAIVNCVGVVTQSVTAEQGDAIFRVTDEYDNLALRYLGENKSCRYLNISSGAAYGSNFNCPPDESTTAQFNLNNIDKSEFYGLAKLYTEAKHRAMSDYMIVDLRLFGFFTHLADIHASFLLSEAACSIIENKTLITSALDITRDYVHPDEFYWLANRCVTGDRMNDVLDVYSAAPVTKFELLEMMRQEFGLKYEIRPSMKSTAIGGNKSRYYSANRKATSVGYQPKYNSLETVRSEMQLLLLKEVN